MVRVASGLLSIGSVLLVMLSFTQPAFAYLDPGTGSLILQLLLGGIAGVTVVVKVYFKGFMARLGLGGQSTETQDNIDTHDR